MVQHMVAKASAAVFVGTDLANNPQLIDSFKNMVVEVGSELSPKPILELLPTISKLRMWFIGKTSPSVKKHRKQLYDALKPEIDRRLKAKELGGSNWERPVIFIYIYAHIHILWWLFLLTFSSFFGLYRTIFYNL